MVTLSNKAVEKVKEILHSENKEEWGLRVGLKQGGCSGFSYSLGIDEKAGSEDAVYEFGGVKVFVNTSLHDLLNGIELDYVDDISGPGFKFSNPNAVRSCGCGKSFDA